MRLDDMYDGELKERILRQEAVLRERLLPEIDWDETEDSSVIEELLGGSNIRHDDAN